MNISMNHLSVPSSKILNKVPAETNIFSTNSSVEYAEYGLSKFASLPLSQLRRLAVCLLLWHFLQLIRTLSVAHSDGDGESEIFATHLLGHLACIDLPFGINKK